MDAENKSIPYVETYWKAKRNGRSKMVVIEGRILLMVGGGAMISDAQGDQVRAVGCYYVEKRKTFGGGR